jgi:branched-subunit amino acid transport protein
VADGGLRRGDLPASAIPSSRRKGHYQPPAWFRRLLPFVPIAALTALTAPELLLVQGEIVLGLDNPRLWAGVVAIAVAAVWRNTLLTIGCGFLALFPDAAPTEPSYRSGQLRKPMKMSSRRGS